MIKLQRGGDGWVVLGTSVLSTSPDIEQAALSALLLAELHGATLELASDVQEGVLERAQQLRSQLEGARKRAISPTP
jgi:hypothetical protein